MVAVLVPIKDPVVGGLEKGESRYRPKLGIMDVESPSALETTT